MRLGVVCEGPTDFCAIKEFLEAASAKRGIEINVLAIQPPRDRTKGGGWTEVVYWLIDNPPHARIATYFGGGLFESGGVAAQCDALILHLDADILSEESFAKFAAKYDLETSDADLPKERARQLTLVIDHFSQIDQLTRVDKRRHLYALAVESSETWCVAAYRRFEEEIERVRGEQLRNLFGAVLDESRGRRAKSSYSNTSKNVSRRAKFCREHRASRFIEDQAPQFRYLVDQVVELSNQH